MTDRFINTHCMAWAGYIAFELASQHVQVRPTNRDNWTAGKMVDWRTERTNGWTDKLYVWMNEGNKQNGNNKASKQPHKSYQKADGCVKGWIHACVGELSTSKEIIYIMYNTF